VANPSIRVEALIGAWEDEYLRSFVSSGGAAVKMVVGDDHDRTEFCKRVRSASTALDYCYCHVDSAQSRFHTMGSLFSAIALQLDWAEISRRFVLTLCKYANYSLDPLMPLSIDYIGQQTGHDASLVAVTFQSILDERILRRVGLSNEFRRAMLGLVGGVLFPNGVPAMNASNIKSWLTGTISNVSQLRPSQIYRRITRNNARNMLVSTARWLRDCGYGGLVATVDLALYSNGGVFYIADGSKRAYSRAAVLDAYDVVRQFLDSSDELEGLFLSFTTDYSFLRDDHRGINAHQALRLRLTDEVYDSNLSNPLSPMLRLSNG